MYNYQLFKQINSALTSIENFDIAGADNLFYTRLLANTENIHSLYSGLYSAHPQGEVAYERLVKAIIKGYSGRAESFKQRDSEKAEEGYWFLSNNIAGMSLYVDRFCGSISKLGGKLDYLNRLGVNLLHLMPLFQSPESESDGGYAVSDFRKIDERFGTLKDLRKVQQEMLNRGMFMMIDVVMNHTSHHHEWAEKARQGEKYYQDFYHFYDDRRLPDLYEETMPEIFPESSPGNFTYVPECNKWVMTVFHEYQWDLNYTNPNVLVEMLDIVLFYANLGVDILRIDAPAFIWKQLGTNCQNLPQAHQLLQLVKLCVQAAAPGMSILGEAIVAPQEIIKYFGEGAYYGKECDFTYNATQMAVQWDALATANTRIMQNVQNDILRKPFGTSWITYTRCHDDIGLAYNDDMIVKAGTDPYLHRSYLKEYFSGVFPDSPAIGALFSSNPKTGDARISGTLASLCGLEKAINEKNVDAISVAIKKILLMQAQSFFTGGVPMLFYGDEAGYTNDYSYLQDPAKSYDNRWMHRPVVNWTKNKKMNNSGTIEQRIFSGTQQLLALRKKLSLFADRDNISWINANNDHVAMFVRQGENKKVYCVFNYSAYKVLIPLRLIDTDADLFDHVVGAEIDGGEDNLLIEPYGFKIIG